MTTRSIFGAFIAVAFAACGGDSKVTNTCGDGEVAGTEQCDDGNTASGDGCSSSCQTESAPVCGDGAVAVGTEQCDDGNTANGDGCSSMCQTEVLCGNGMLDGAEACDDGNTADNDGCSATCAVESGFTCTGEPSDCTQPTGACSSPFLLTLANNAGTLEGTGTGDTTASTDQVPAAECDTFNSGGAPDHIWQFTLTETRDVTIEITTATPFDAVLRLMAAPCDQTTEIKEYNGADGCSDSGVAGEGELLGYSALPAGTYYVVIDGYDATEVGAYTFTVSAAPTTCGDGTIDLLEICDDGNTTASDGCSASCDVEPGYTCTGTPSVCTSACGNGTLDGGEECEDDNTMDGDRCSATCTLEYDVAEVESNNTTPQMITASNHLIRGALTAGDVDLYTFTLAAPATVELETYNAMNNLADYGGVGTTLDIDCLGGLDTEIRVFDATGDVTMNTTALAYDDDDGDVSCSYVGPNDSLGNTQEGVLAAGTYTIKVNHFMAAGTATVYILDLKIASNTPVAPVAGDLVLNEFMAADNMSDTNCDGATTGTKDEFVELVNVSSKVLDLTGLTIADSVVVRHTFAAGPTGSMTLDPGKAIVVWGGGAPACTGVTDWFVASTGQLGLNDSGDTITVKDAAAATLLTHVYPAATLNKSSNLSPDVTGTTYALHAMVAGAVGDFSPGKRANGTAF
jgi:cysteine-rich repeat protein